MMFLVSADQSTQALRHGFDVAQKAYILAQELPPQDFFRLDVFQAAYHHDRHCPEGYGSDITYVREMLRQPAELPQELFVHPLVKGAHDFKPEVALAIEQHHERLDGSGYPHGLAGDQICRLARILAVVDTWQECLDNGLDPTYALVTGAESGQLEDEYTQAMISLFMQDVRIMLNGPAPNTNVESQIRSGVTTLQGGLEPGGIARMDPTTGLPNQPYFLDLLQTEFARYNRFRIPFSLASIYIPDIEDAAKDPRQNQLLLHVATRLKQLVRVTDVLGYGGNGLFLALLVGTTKAGADIAVTRLKARCSSGTDYVVKITELRTLPDAGDCIADTPQQMFLRVAPPSLRRAAATHLSLVSQPPDDDA